MNRKTHPAILFHTIAVAGLSLALGIKPAIAQSYTLTTLATFNGAANGANPYGGVALDSSGNLYGTTYKGGTNGVGTVFEIAAGTNTPTTLATFSGAANGQYPNAGITLDSKGNLYGTTESGGANNIGTVFKIAAGTNTLTTLATFNDTNGRVPIAGLTLDSSGDLYGTTLGGGANSDGTVFKIVAGTNTLITLATFNSSNGNAPQAGISFDSSGNLYGTTSGGGIESRGTVFEIAAGTNTITTLANFYGANGNSPQVGITLDSSGNLYGTTAYGGDANSDGTVFKIAAGTNTLTTLAAFNGTNGYRLYGGITLDSSGNLYGTTAYGGANNDGTVFKIAAGTNALTTLATFNNANGYEPSGDLTLDGNGNFYGTTGGGGANGDGTVFELTPSGSVSAPEPAALVLLLPALATLGFARRRPCARRSCAG